MFERIRHKLFGTHFTRYGEAINARYWRLADKDVIGQQCYICKEWVKRPE